MSTSNNEKVLDDTPTALQFESASQDFESQEEYPGFKWDYYVLSNLLALCFVVFCNSWVSTVPSSAIAFIAKRFPEEASNSAWIATAPFICGAAVASFIGDLSDIFDRKIFILASCCFSLVGQLIAARAGSLAMVIGAQTINGIGSGIAFLSNPLLIEIVPKLQRPYATAASTFVSSFAFIGGPVLEGLFIQKKLGGELDGWRIGFYLGAGFEVIAFILLLIFYHPMPRVAREGHTVMQELKKIDILGIFLGTAGATLFLVGINYGGNQHSWSSAMVLGMLISGLACIAGFVTWNWKGTAHGIIPHAIFVDRNFAITVVMRVVGGFALYGSQAFLPQMVVYVFGKDGLTTAVWALPFNISTVLGAFCAAFLLRKLKEIKWIVVGLLAVLILGAGLMVAVKPDVSFALWFFGSILMGLAIGTEASSLTIIASLTVPNEFIATGVCIGVAASYLGGAVATTMYSQIFLAKVQDIVPSAVASAAVAAGVAEDRLSDFVTAYFAGNAAALATIPGVSVTVLAGVLSAAQFAYAEAFQYIWYVLIAWCGASLVVAFLFGSTKQYMTMEVAAPVQRPSEKTN